MCHTSSSPSLCAGEPYRSVIEALAVVQVFHPRTEWLGLLLVMRCQRVWSMLEKVNMMPSCQGGPHQNADQQSQHGANDGGNDQQLHELSRHVQSFLC